MPTLFASSILRSLFTEHLSITLVIVLGAAAIYLLLPRPRGQSLLPGALLGVGALVLGGWRLLGTPPTPESILFYGFSAVAMIAGALLVTQRNPARAALAFALVVLSTCGLFLLLAAPFLMAATVIVYAGAIVVTFLFVIMLAQQEGLSAADQRSREPLLATIAGFLLLGTLLYVLAVGAGQDRERSEHLRRVQEYQQAILALSRESAGDDETAARRSLELLDDLGSSLARLRSPSPEQPSAAQLGGEDLDRTVRLAEEEVAVQQFRLLDGKTVDWGRVSDTLARVGNRLAGLQPRQGLSLSDLSGPAPNQDLRRDANGRPEMPAENVAYLGRSLFTDYLIAVELGGTLLLVATIGAIAIAQRRREGP